MWRSVKTVRDGRLWGDHRSFLQTLAPLSLSVLEQYYNNNNLGMLSLANGADISGTVGDGVQVSPPRVSWPTDNNNQQGLVVKLAKTKVLR